MKRSANEATATPVSAAHKVSRAVADFFLPMVDGETPAATSFSTASDAEEIWAFDQLVQLFAEDRRHKAAILEQVDSLCDKSEAVVPAQGLVGL